MSVVKKREEIIARIDSLAYGGKGVARINDFVVFIQGALPGQKVRASVTKVKKSYAEARTLQVLEESPFHVEPRCQHFGECGGCLLQNLDYSKQIEYKGLQVQELLERVGGFRQFELLPTLPSFDIYYYRNKMEFSFARDRWLSSSEIASGISLERQGCFLGLHARGFYDKVVDLGECHLIKPISSGIVDFVRETAVNSGLPVHSTVDHAGFWRFLVVRCSAFTENLMVNVITSEFKPDIAAVLRDELTAKFPAITSLYNGVTRSKAGVAFCEEEHLLAGNVTIIEKISNFQFRLSPNSFFQTNSKQIKRLYDVILQLAEFQGNETVYDLYCGAGAISIYVSPFVRRVVGFESVNAAVDNARENCLDNRVDNCEFVLGDLKDRLSNTAEVVHEWGNPDIIILDPPRGGLHPKTAEAVLALAPQKIIHVSCNPSTLARELAEFCKNDYVLRRVQPVDMFPHTAHVEVVAQLIRK
jgi:23S rRNA (uracil1939-C5)-methyltransferase